MDATLRMSPTDRTFAPVMLDLLKATARELILMTNGLYLVWQVAVSAGQPAAYGMRAAPGMILAAVSGGLALWLLPGFFLAAQITWLVGLTATLLVHEAMLGHTYVALIYGLLPLIAALTIGRAAGLLAIASALLLVASRVYTGFPLPLSPADGTPIAISAIFAGLVGQCAARSLLTVTRWSLFHFDQACRKVEEARDQRLELKQAQEDLLQANKELTRLSERLKGLHQIAEEARRTKEEFVANVSHEFRTPLNMIIGFSDMLLRSSAVYGTQLPSRVLADIAAIERNSRHLSKLVDDVLDLSQADSDRLPLDRQWVALTDIVTGAVETVRRLFEAKGLDLRVECSPDAGLVFCDATRIRQVLINLLSNAGRFTERGGVTVQVIRDHNAVTVAVADTGPGIAPEDQKRLFEPFQQLDSSIRRRFGGSGLGLSISKRFVELHGGTMWLDSEPGVGTTFYFRLPANQAVPVSVARADDALRWFNPYEATDLRARTRPFRVPSVPLTPRYVVLEPANALQQLLRRHLGDVEIAHVKDLDEAVAALNQAPALALLVNAPPATLWRDGAPNLSNPLTCLPYATPAITCWVPGEEDIARRMGVVRYLVKPISRDTLVTTLETMGTDHRTVLLVDDDQEVLQLFTRMLSGADAGYRVLRARSGQQALDMMRQRRPDVVLLDLVMPGMDGYQVLQEKSQDATIQAIPVIITSSRDPDGAPIAADLLAVTRGGGLSVRDLMICIRTLSEKLSLERSSAGPKPPGNPAA